MAVSDQVAGDKVDEPGLVELCGKILVGGAVELLWLLPGVLDPVDLGVLLELRGPKLVLKGPVLDPDSDFV